MQGWEEEAVDERIRKTLNREFDLPREVEEAKEAAFARIRAMEKEKGRARGTRSFPGKRRGGFWRACAGLTAAAAAFSAVCIANPAFAARIPLVGRVFEELGSSLGFSGDYGKYAQPVGTQGGEGGADPLEIEGKRSDGDLSITLSETYCNASALYVSLILESQEGFPDTQIDQNGSPVLYLSAGLTMDFLQQELPVHQILDGRFIDKNTFAGVLRYDLSNCAQVKEDGTVLRPEVPESFHMSLKADRVVGDKADAAIPEMPKDIREAYEMAMRENGLSLEAEDYEKMTEEQQETERLLYKEMMDAYGQRYPEAAQYPNRYENWWIDGSWEFDLDVNRDERDTVTVQVDDVDEEGVGLVSATRTPFEIIIQDGGNPDTFTVALDADGDILPYGGAGDANTYAIQDRDVSRIDVYVCDYQEYMDQLKGYYWSEDYEEKKKTKTFGELLNERALYHREVVFD
ncbi:MAG: DUF4179 domain-containing protein [Eubacteriales bacterium]|nr:DUF4179 domain-containing protein [Eubacteriales bacterium]